MLLATVRCHTVCRPPSALRPGQIREARGWHSRGYLPHFDAAGVVQSITFRLGDCLPKEKLDEWRTELGI